MPLPVLVMSFVFLLYTSIVCYFCDSTNSQRHSALDHPSTLRAASCCSR